ncbi:alpha/beta hydrolase family protein [Tellurirhabdus bombi]|uniref:alpha/beta hydrolase family protein n=1 Tax=Tellurirhabdus bombi TaxID=2907205 RepID=UPI001F3AC7CF|nr:lipase family protein [Tellurirhabdus bombi]
MFINRKDFLLSLLVSTTTVATGFMTSSCSKDPDPIENKYLVSATEIRSLTLKQLATQVQAINPGLAFLVRNEVKVYKITYNTQLPDGTPTLASGALLVPNATSPVPMISQQHATIRSEADAPSNFGPGSDAYSFGSLFASLGYIISCPDYIGYGEAKSQPHPYEHRESLASASLDMLRAAREFVAQNGVKWNNKVFLTGYSEGGFAAMSLLKKLEEEHPNEFTIAGASLGSGAYDKSGFLTRIINTPSSGIAAYNQLYLWVLLTYNNIYKLNRPMTDYFKEPYATQIAAQKELANINVSLHQTFTDSFKQAITNGTDKAFLDAIADNNVYDWKPKTPIRLYHGNADDLVLYFNSQNAYDAMKKRGATNVQLYPLEGKNHATAIIDYLLGTYELVSTTL